MKEKKANSTSVKINGNDEGKKFTIEKINLILIGISFLIIIIGFFLMAGPATIVDFEPDIFSTRRIVVGPMISFFGFLSMVFSILYKPKKDKE